MSQIPPPSSSESSSYEYRDSSTARDSAPLGIYIIAIIGGIVSLFGFFLTLMIMGQGGGLVLVGLFLFALNAGQLYVLVGLVRLEPWAWTWALFLYGLGALIDLVTVDFLGLIIGLVIIVYLVSKADYYEK
jgi:hypothetical protein